MEKGLISVKVIFKDGVFVPLEPVSIPEGTEGIVVYSEKNITEKLPHWWDIVNKDEEFKRALKSFIEKITSVVIPEEVKLINRDDDYEIVVILENDEAGFLKPIMETGYGIYQTTGVFLPIQVISKKRLKRWKDFDREIFYQIENGISLLRG
ncbi:antitoxin AF2212-like protein [Desulfurobacterium atlanticum]|uniref:Uncharacterized protein n=1 Tax=Desulfurobacterium atlanticum TaxID=240169 RepID=A0A238Y5U8_9BACT|nr:antitoxin AF2212-like protein [Desulfurobacterium atlanticum]SNR65709.1 Protein of unknown function DUF104 [Desulfurobacterium atlanticum]